MPNKVKTVKKVAEVIKMLNGGIEFYADATKQVKSSQLISVFGRMMSARQNAIEKLQPFAIAEQGERENDSSLAIKVRNMYSNLLSTFSFDSDHTIVSQLEEVEDKTLKAIKDALDQEQPEVCKNALLNVLHDIQNCHDEMKSLQQETA